MSFTHLKSTVQHEWHIAQVSAAAKVGHGCLLQTCAVHQLVQTSAELGGTVVYVAEWSDGLHTMYYSSLQYKQQQQQPSAPKFFL